MKTAMQELISTFHLYQNSASTYEEQELLSFYIKCAEDLLQKEKEQIIDAWIATNNELERLAAEVYYIENYNQN